MHYAEIIEGYADQARDGVALVHGDTRRTWSEFEERAARWLGGRTAAILDYQNSGDVTGDREQVVGYAACAVS